MTDPYTPCRTPQGIPGPTPSDLLRSSTGSPAPALSWGGDWNRYAAWLFSVCLRRRVQDGDVQDAVQEVLAALGNFRRFRGAPIPDRHYDRGWSPSCAQARRSATRSGSAPRGDPSRVLGCPDGDMPDRPGLRRGRRSGGHPLCPYPRSCATTVRRAEEPARLPWRGARGQDRRGSGRRAGDGPGRRPHRPGRGGSAGSARRSGSRPPPCDTSSTSGPGRSSSNRPSRGRTPRSSPVVARLTRVRG